MAIRVVPFIRCRTCGRYLPAPAAVRQHYCSEACAEPFGTCPTCGKYFSLDHGFRGTYCSRECSVQYRMNRSFGPKPVVVVSEEME